jgi:glutamate synthase domain-containing protein 3
LTTRDCGGMTTRQINLLVRELTAAGETDIRLLNPAAHHNLLVALFGNVRVTLDGSAGYFCAGMIDGPTVVIDGNVGWSVAENMMSGHVTVNGNAGSSTGATIRGGTLIVRGNAGARTGIAMKGGTIVVRGDSGYMTGFMMQRGAMIICGDAGEALGDSMYTGRIFVGGTIAELGNDAVIEPLTDDDHAFLADTLDQADIENGYDFKKVVSGRRLWNFSKKEMGLWIQAL